MSYVFVELVTHLRTSTCYVCRYIEHNAKIALLYSTAIEQMLSGILRSLAVNCKQHNYVQIGQNTCTHLLHLKFTNFSCTVHKNVLSLHRI